MGACVCTKKHKNGRIALVNQIRSSRETPIVFIEENFKIVDYTQVLKDIKDVTDIRKYFNDYKPTDIRCIKRKNESKQEHSHLIISFNQILHGEIIREVGLITDYSPYGFAISIGEMKEIQSICNLNSISLELLHLPKADNQEKISLADVIEWAWEHKDEQYMNPRKIPECNMGKRIFRYISSILADKNNNFRA